MPLASTRQGEPAARRGVPWNVMSILEAQPSPTGDFAMELTIVSAGLACVIAAIAGGGLKTFHVEVPGIASLSRQILLGMFGVLLLVVGFWNPLGFAIGSEGLLATDQGAVPAADGLGADVDLRDNGGSESESDNGDSGGAEGHGSRDRAFDVALGVTIAPGMPAAGAGELEDIGAQDTYRFEGRAGGRISIVTEALDDDQHCRGTFSPYLDVFDPLGGDLDGAGRSSWLSGSTSCRAHAFDLPMDGTYELVVAGPLDATGVGTYQLRLVDLSGDRS
jgi:hypothetical protein